MTAQIDAIDITFLGTASAVPSATRAHSSLALRLQGEIWLFDAGEGVQLQLYKSSLKPGSVTRIFITHMHGDHVFGLPPLVASIAVAETDLQTTADALQPGTPRVLEIYGPRGLRAYLRNALRYSYTYCGLWRVHELLLPGEEPVMSVEQDEQNRHPSERIGSTLYATTEAGSIIFRDVLASTDPHPHVQVHAAPIQHSCPCLGFVMDEGTVPGKIGPDVVQAIQRNAQRITAEMGIRVPMTLLQRLKADEIITLPDGTLLTPPPRQPGRRIVILGDTFEPRNIAALAKDADVLVHEATNAYLPGIPGVEMNALETEESVKATAIAHGHSTPDMAGRFAKEVGARLLLLNHFSSRYKGDMANAESAGIMEAIRQRAVKTFGHDAVITAHDWLTVPLRRRKG